MSGASEAEWITARNHALAVVHLWKAPRLVREYLRTGLNDMKEPAGEAAWLACREANAGCAWVEEAAAAAAGAAAAGDASGAAQWAEYARQIAR